MRCCAIIFLLYIFYYLYNYFELSNMASIPTWNVFTTFYISNANFEKFRKLLFYKLLFIY